MKRVIRGVRTVVLLLGLLTSIGCGLSSAGLIATVRPTAVEEARQTAEITLETSIPATLTAVAATQTVALLTVHGRYVAASGAGGGWLLGQESELDTCGWFTLHFLENGKVALTTCHDRYVTAPESGRTRADWLLWQEPDLSECGQFVLHETGAGVALETCAGRYWTPGDDSWEPGLAWSVVAETQERLGWEVFTLLRHW